MNSIIDGLDIAPFSEDTVKFLNNFSEILYNLGGNNLVQQINAELVLSQRAGGNLLEVIFDIYEDFRQSYERSV